MGAAPEGGGTSAAAADFTKQGDIELWQGKDVSGNVPKLVKQFNDSHPNGKVTLHELPDSADQQRQQMIQNAQIKNPKMAVLRWTWSGPPSSRPRVMWRLAAGPVHRGTAEGRG